MYCPMSVLNGAAVVEGYISSSLEWAELRSPSSSGKIIPAFDIDVDINGSSCTFSPPLLNIRCSAAVC